jgi:hypothetical protein
MEMRVNHLIGLSFEPATVKIVENGNLSGFADRSFESTSTLAPGFG